MDDADNKQLEEAGIDPNQPLLAYAITYLYSVPSQQLQFVPAVEGLWFKEEIDTTHKLRQAAKIIAMGLTAQGAPSDIQVTVIGIMRMPGDDTTMGNMQAKADEINKHYAEQVPSVPPEEPPTVEKTEDGGVVVKMPERAGAKGN